MHRKRFTEKSVLGLSRQNPNSPLHQRLHNQKASDYTVSGYAKQHTPVGVTTGESQGHIIYINS